MYKLVVVGGKLRGKEFTLEKGENFIGRDAACNVALELDGISKKHLQITVLDDVAYVEDLGSSNGTFINGKLIKKMTIKGGDKIALPNVIFQLVHIVEKKVIVKKKVAKTKEVENIDDLGQAEAVPPNLVGKILHTFKFKIMPIFYGFNKEYEWRSLVAIVLVAFIVVTISMTIFPVLLDNKQVLLSEIGKRGFHYADEIARLNAVALERKDLDRIDTNFLNNEPGVESYELFDLEGRIVRPLGKINEYITDTFSIAARDAGLKNLEKYVANLGDGQYGISKTIKAYNVRTGVEEPVGVIAIRFAPDSLVLEAANNSKAYLEAFTTSALIGIFFFAIIYYLTVKHLDDLKLQIETVLRGKAKEVVPRFKMAELKALMSSINGLLQKNRELQGDGSIDVNEIEDDGKYVKILEGFLAGANGPAMVLNSEKLIKHVNPEAEDVTGIRQTSGEGMSLLDIARDQGFAATVIDLCDQSATMEGACTKGEYELTGNPYQVCVNALIGKDHFAKAFYITFVKDN